jgi:hypothetical protein
MIQGHESSGNSPGILKARSERKFAKMDGRCEEAGSKIKIRIRLAELNKLHRRLEKRKVRFRNLQENAIAVKIENIRKLLNSICSSAPAVISSYALPRWYGRRKPRRGSAPQLRWPPYP